MCHEATSEVFLAQAKCYISRGDGLIETLKLDDSHVPHCQERKAIEYGRLPVPALQAGTVEEGGRLAV